VHFDRGHRKKERRSDFCVRKSFGDEAENLGFARGQRVKGRILRSSIIRARNNGSDEWPKVVKRGTQGSVSLDHSWDPLIELEGKDIGIENPPRNRYLEVIDELRRSSSRRLQGNKGSCTLAEGLGLVLSGRSSHAFQQFVSLIGHAADRKRKSATRKELAEKSCGYVARPRIHGTFDGIRVPSL
jgi:hypothetical protein